MRKPLKSLGIIGTVGVPAKYGGFETLVHQLVLNLNKEFDMTVYSSGYAYPKSERVGSWEGAKIKYIPLKANGFQSIFYDICSMIHALYCVDVLLILGVSGCIFLPFLKTFSKKKVIVNIDGLEWRRPKWNWFAKRFLLFSEKIACKFADEIITDNRILKEYVKIRYNISSQLIEYGADHTKRKLINDSDIEEYPFLKEKYAFKVSRIEPENNIHLILKAFSKLPKQQLVLVGNWNDNLYGAKLREKYRKFKNLHLLDPIYATLKLDVLRSNAHFYVHGNSAGGTNPSLVEAMYLKLPVLSFDAIFNRVTTNNQAIYFSDENELMEIISKIDQYPLYAIAENLKTIANKQYTWKNISQRYAVVIDGRKKMPDFLSEFKNSVPFKIGQKVKETVS
jgi:glycosyltransferase involved in cell wall biosynthesis